MADTIKLRRGTATQWSTANPVLADGEPGYDITNDQIRIGNGVSAWSGLDPLDASAMSGSAILSALSGSDGAGSGLDADLLDGQQGTSYSTTSTIGSALLGSGGVVDQATELQALLTATGSGVSRIAGTFLINSEVVVPSTGGGIQGLGRNTRIILGSAGARLRINAQQTHAHNFRVDGGSIATNGVVFSNAAYFTGSEVLVSGCTGTGVLVDPGATGNCNTMNLHRWRSISNSGHGFEVADATASSANSTSLVLDDCDGSTNGGNGALVRNGLGAVRGGKYTGNTLYGIKMGLSTDTLVTDDWLIANPRLEDNVAGPFSEGKGNTALLFLVDSYTTDAGYEVNAAGNNWRLNHDTSVGGFHIHNSDGTSWQFRTSDKSTRIPGFLQLANTNDTVTITVVTGSPEGALSARPGSIALREDGAAGSAFYIKNSGNGNTGWVAFNPLNATTYDANTILKADADDTPTALTVGFNTLVGRGASGNISALTQTQAKLLLGFDTLFSGTGSPEGSVTSTVGGLFRRTDGATGSTLYVKESGSGNTGWLAVSATASAFAITLLDDANADTARTTLGVDRTPVPPLVTGRWYRFPNISSSNTAILTTGLMHASPKFISSDITLDRLGAEVTLIGDAGSKVRLGIYADDGTGRPGSLVLDAGTIAGDSASVQAITISQALTRGWYWFAQVTQIVTTTGPQVRTMFGAAEPIPLDFTAMPGAGGVTLALTVSGVTGALPSTFGSPGRSASGISLIGRVV